MIGLRIDQHLLGVFLDRQGVQPLDGNLQPLHHGDIVEPADLVGVTDGHALHAVAEQPLEGHGRGDGVGVGVDDDEDRVGALEQGPQPVEPRLGGVLAGAAGYVVVRDFFKSFLHGQKVPRINTAKCMRRTSGRGLCRPSGRLPAGWMGSRPVPCLPGQGVPSAGGGMKYPGRQEAAILPQGGNEVQAVSCARPGPRKPCAH